LSLQILRAWTLKTLGPASRLRSIFPLGGGCPAERGAESVKLGWGEIGDGGVDASAFGPFQARQGLLEGTVALEAGISVRAIAA
jgi:hypothetical protein